MAAGAVAGAAVVVVADRVGLGWRRELAPDILGNLQHIDILEVIAEDYVRADKGEIGAMRRLARQVPLSLHGVAMGLASTIAVPPERVQKMAHLVAALEPESWSEHLAFVRAGGVEIGHLAAPPRSAQSVAGAIANIAIAARAVGSMPLLENIATLINPPASTMDEAQWVGEIVRGSGAPLLLDLHNLYANACNFGQNPYELLLRFPLEHVGAVHISGGRWIAEPGGSGRKRLLDDHLHDVPDAVHDLLALLAERAPQSLTVILERDGHFPDFESLLFQLHAARASLRRGRERAKSMREAA